ncbi:MAG: hypothetical protein HFJ52_02590 [Clostridia bacterium]|nr:hypothetical protein [Clostridia bacterium]
MKKRNIKKVLFIISIIIICLGIISGLNISNEIENVIPNERIYVDGSDFSGLVQLGGIISSKILGTLIIFGSICIDIIIWILYGLILVILKVIKRMKDKRTV